MTQRASRFTLWVTVAVLLALSTSAQPVGAAEERIPVTDPALLQELGLAPDARNVYTTPEVHAYLLMSPAERAAVEEAAVALDESALSESEASSAFGNTNGVSTVHASDFAPTVINPDTRYQVGGTGGGISGEILWCNFDPGGNPTDQFVGVFRDIPHGARLRSPRIWYYDDSADENVRAWVQRTCLGFGLGEEPETTILRMNESSGQPGYALFGAGSLLGEDVDNHRCVHSVRVQFSAAGGCSEGSLLRLLKATMHWRRQVSPAPVTATFDDVPTDHLFFQHIEALATSGITSGCDADSFCPNDPLTRGQMAVFLATALGLNWEGPFFEP